MSNKTFNYNGFTIEISTAPVIYYKISVHGDRGDGRRMQTTPIAIEEGIPFDRIDEVQPGENIIACIPAALGTFEVYVEWYISDDSDVADQQFGAESLGLDIPGGETQDWNQIAREMVEMHTIKE